MTIFRWHLVQNIIVNTLDIIWQLFKKIQRDEMNDLVLIIIEAPMNIYFLWSAVSAGKPLIFKVGM
jgi:hypothetical protein